MSAHNEPADAARATAPVLARSRMARVAVASALAVLIGGCAVAEDDTATSESALEGRKRAYADQSSITCSPDPLYKSTELTALTRLRVGPGSAPLDRPVLRPFFSDGCTAAPDDLPLSSDDGWQDCCVRHDVRYWLGGTEAEKSAADDALEKCIENTGHPRVADLYKSAVKKFGGPGSGQLYRWGYGWNREQSYGPVPASTEAQVKALYGTSLSKLTKHLLEDDYELERICDTPDPGVAKLTQRDHAIYALLAKKLRTADTVVWARFVYFNLEIERYDVKLAHCETPIVITFSKRDGSVASYESACE